MGHPESKNTREFWQSSKSRSRAFWTGNVSDQVRDQRLPALLKRPAAAHSDPLNNTGD